MNQVELIILLPQSGDQYSQGLFDLESIPRMGEFIFYDRWEGAKEGIYKVMEVTHKIEPKGPITIFMVSIEEES